VVWRQKSINVMSKRGVSLIETMVAMVLLLIITLSSAYFFAIPPFRKEALRFAALERAAGMLDLISVAQSEPKTNMSSGIPINNYYKISDETATNTLFFSTATTANEMIISKSMPSVWYTLRVTAPEVGETVPLNSTMRRAELKLYDKQDDTNSLFGTFRLLLPPSG